MVDIYLIYTILMTIQSEIIQYNNYRVRIFDFLIILKSGFKDGYEFKTI